MCGGGAGRVQTRPGNVARARSVPAAAVAPESKQVVRLEVARLLWSVNSAVKTSAEEADGCLFRVAGVEEKNLRRMR